ncbi:MAG TPA: 16S rRNA (guanine(966)-N(2))-methyltransferase RsmD [Acidobacteriota bacterium]|nr:16S rRNA (guanine(966)-N(2))-methyltransferase RsmD [Acidobacteriota bacterium]
MRIIAGEFRGRKLTSPRGITIRPTADRLKETLFDILGPGIRGAVLLDAFAGTGSIGLEAISRGARETVFVEVRPDAARLIRQNLELCGVKSGYRILQQEAFSALRLLSREGFSADIVFLDPPYDFKPYADLLEILFDMRLNSGDARIIIEHDRWATLPAAGTRYRRTRVVRQGDHCLSFYGAPDGLEICAVKL